ncbi:crystallin J1 [Salinibacterium sp. dk2585]|uniref:ADP-ribosylglycohydrolase family protein n=1 Tax=unclassified Salinibacterium TaxID=2632331 RepID=UPI0011C25026|nr:MULTISPECIES: ADP-ribosylglycohydrolase family protein [unclassified Salinibacterium]QEE60300.1 crystallin J1 [Salinibacterium sp. dk2585]TXK55372.1 crystallin J1 [Salinibacterium sp. dk5596]
MSIDRARGAIIGLAVGDAMGADTEGMTLDAIRQRFGRVVELPADAAGTDDTEYAVLCAQGVIRHGSELTSEHVAELWLDATRQQQGGFHGAGFSEMAAIANLMSGATPPASGRNSYETWSDGAAMRVAPLGVFAAGDPAEAARLATIDAAVSHSRDGIHCATAIAAAVAVAMVSDDHQAVLAAGRAAVPDDSWTARSIDRALALVSDIADIQEAERLLYDGVSILHYPWADAGPEAVALAFGLFAAAEGDFVSSVVAGVNIGRDSDTIAAMVGAMAGAMVGYDAIPSAWREQVEEVRGRCILATAGTNLVQLADDLVARAEQERNPQND